MTGSTEEVFLVAWGFVELFWTLVICMTIVDFFIAFLLLISPGSFGHFLDIRTI